MQRMTFIAQTIVRITGLIQIVLGVLFWFGIGTSLVLVHIISGLIFVLALWVLAGASLASQADKRLGGFALLYGVMIAALGLNQAALLVGPLHWMIQIVHLLIGLGGMGIAQSLSTRTLVGAADKHPLHA